MKKLYTCMCVALTVIFIFSSILTVAADSVQYIYTENDLKSISNDLSGSYRLMNDIVLSEKWVPIGTAASPFTGTFDGNGHSVKNITLGIKKSYCGLFAFVYGAKISDLSLYGSIDDRISLQRFERITTSYCGAFAGGCRDSVFENCNNYCDVSCDSYAGGFCGISLGSDFVNCRNYGDIIAESYCGGICGRLTGGSVSICSNSAKITADTYTGGLIGQTYANSNYNTIMISDSFNTGKTVAYGVYGGGILGSSTADGITVIDDCFNLGSVFSDSTTAILGGIVGGTSPKTSHSLTVSNCYNAGIITLTNACGGIAGENKLTASDCFFLDNSVSHGIPNASDIPLTYAQMCIQTSFTDFDFINTWEFAPNGEFKYPRLKSNPIIFDKKPAELSIASLPVLTECVAGDTSFSTSGLALKVIYTDGTVETLTSGFTVQHDTLTPGPNKITLSYGGASAYYNINMFASYSERDLLRSLGNGYIPIYSGDNLETARFFPNNSYFFMNDVKVTDFAGIGSIDEPFTGTVIGNGYTVTLDGSSSALFNVCDGAAITDIKISGNISASGCAGSVVCHARNTLLHGVVSDAAVKASPSFDIAYCGGIAGYYECTLSDATGISECRFSGSVITDGYADNTAAGGIAGMCFAASGSKPSITGSASYGSITATGGDYTYAGGIVGIIASSGGISHSTVSECFNFGNISVEAINIMAGGLIGGYRFASGSANSTLSAENLFNAGDIYVRSDLGLIYAGGIISSLDNAGATLAHAYTFGDIDCHSYNTVRFNAVVATAISNTVSDCFCFSDNDSHAVKLAWNDSVKQASFENFDFTDIWTFRDGYLHPQLVNIPIDVSMLTAAESLPAEIIGTPDIGATLTANAPMPAVFEWLIDGNTAATGDVYIPDESDLGKTVILRARYCGAFTGYSEASVQMPAYRRIASPLYDITDAKITGVAPGTYVGEMFANLLYLPANYSMLRNGEVLDGNDKVSSGCILVVGYPQGDIAYTVSVKGDINGDGLADAFDASVLREYLLKGGNIPYFDAADMNGDGIINAKDSVLLKQYVHIT